MIFRFTFFFFKFQLNTNMCHEFPDNETRSSYFYFYFLSLARFLYTTWHVLILLITRHNAIPYNSHTGAALFIISLFYTFVFFFFVRVITRRKKKIDTDYLFYSSTFRILRVYVRRISYALITNLCTQTRSNIKKERNRDTSVCCGRGQFHWSHVQKGDGIKKYRVSF